MEVKLEPLNLRHASTSYKWRNIPEIWKYTFNRPSQVITIKDEQEWINKILSRSDEYRFAILADGKYVGNTYLTHLKVSSARFQIFIGEINSYGKGIGRKATLLILLFAFEELKLEKVELNVDVRNKRALRLYYSVGFKKISKDENTIKMEITRLEYQ